MTRREITKRLRYVKLPVILAHDSNLKRKGEWDETGRGEAPAQDSGLRREEGEWSIEIPVELVYDIGLKRERDWDKDILMALVHGSDLRKERVFQRSLKFSWGGWWQAFTEKYSGVTIWTYQILFVWQGNHMPTLLTHVVAVLPFCTNGTYQGVVGDVSWLFSS